MNTIIAIVWARDWAVVSFTDVENIYTISLGEVTTSSSAKARIRRVMFKYYGIKLSRLRLEKTIGAIYYYRSDRVES